MPPTTEHNAARTLHQDKDWIGPIQHFYAKWVGRLTQLGFYVPLNT